jgi:hypothetical protein
VINTGATGVIVGEYACTLDPATWSLLPTGQDQRSVKKQFGNIQCEYFSSKAGGAFYWTLKMDWMDVSFATESKHHNLASGPSVCGT